MLKLENVECEDFLRAMSPEIKKLLRETTNNHEEILAMIEKRLLAGSTTILTEETLQVLEADVAKVRYGIQAVAQNLISNNQHDQLDEETAAQDGKSCTNLSTDVSLQEDNKPRCDSPEPGSSQPDLSVRETSLDEHTLTCLEQVDQYHTSELAARGDSVEPEQEDWARKDVKDESQDIISDCLRKHSGSLPHGLDLEFPSIMTVQEQMKSWEAEHDQLQEQLFPSKLRYEQNEGSLANEIGHLSDKILDYSNNFDDSSTDIQNRGQSEQSITDCCKSIAAPSTEDKLTNLKNPLDESRQSVLVSRESAADFDSEQIQLREATTTETNSVTPEDLNAEELSQEADVLALESEKSKHSWCSVITPQKNCDFSLREDCSKTDSQLTYEIKTAKESMPSYTESAVTSQPYEEIAINKKLSTFTEDSLYPELGLTEEEERERELTRVRKCALQTEIENFYARSDDEHLIWIQKKLKRRSSGWNTVNADDEQISESRFSRHCHSEDLFADTPSRSKRNSTQAGYGFSSMTSWDFRLLPFNLMFILPLVLLNELADCVLLISQVLAIIFAAIYQFIFTSRFSNFVKLFIIVAAFYGAAWFPLQIGENPEDLDNSVEET